MGGVVVPGGDTACGLILLSELSEHLQLTRNTPDNDAILELIGKAASAQVEKFCDRKFLNADYTEYHDIVQKGQDEIVLNQWPVTDSDASTFHVYSVSWDGDGSETTTELTQNVDFFVYAEQGIIKFASTRYGGLKRIKVIYDAGYEEYADVPYDIRQVIKDYCGRAWQQRYQYGRTGESTSLGGTINYNKPDLTEEEKRVLSGYMRVSL